MPSIATISPSQYDDGEIVTLSGSGFGANQGQGYVNINGVLQPISNWADDQIQFTATRGAGSMGAHKVCVIPGPADEDQWIFQGLRDGIDPELHVEVVGANTVVWDADQGCARVTANNQGMCGIQFFVPPGHTQFLAEFKVRRWSHDRTKMFKSLGLGAWTGNHYSNVTLGASVGSYSGAANDYLGLSYDDRVGGGDNYTSMDLTGTLKGGGQYSRNAPVFNVRKAVADFLPVNGTWKKIKIWAVFNEDSAFDGEFAVWEDDVLVFWATKVYNAGTPSDSYYRERKYLSLAEYANAGGFYEEYKDFNIGWTRPVELSNAILGPALYKLSGNELPSGTVFSGSQGNRMVYDNTRAYVGTQSIKCQMLLGQPPASCGGSHFFGGRFTLPTLIPEGYNIWFRVRCYLPSTLPMGYCFGSSDAADATTCSKFNDGSGSWKWLVLAPDTGTARIYTNLRVPRRAMGLNNGILVISEPQNDGNLTNTTQVIPRDQWFTLEMQVFTSSVLNGGFIRVWVDNTYIGQHNKRTLANSAYKIKEWGIGDYANGVPWTDGDGARTDLFWIDDVILMSDFPGYRLPAAVDSGGRPRIGTSMTVEDL